MVEKFKQLGISETSLKAIKELGFEEPSEIQEKSIPLVLEGKDIIAGASTGSGKTLAFGLGIINNTKKDYGIQGLILTPTRELAEQITKELRKFSITEKFNVVPIYGGVSMSRQIDELKSAEIVVATPGRLLDHLSRRTINLQYIKTLVLDEADRMLDMGFKDDVDKIISQCPKERQTLLYSATISSDIVKMSEKYMKNPVEVSAKSHVDPTKLTQIYHDVQDNLKYSLLKYLLEHDRSKLSMVFCNTRNNVDFLANNLRLAGIEALPIHGGFTQDKRSKILAQFHSKEVQVLICTDVAARGLDIPEVSHIYNYDIPKDAKEYVHRIGRTARAGKEGKVINIITSRDYDNFSSVLKHHPELKITNEKTPYVERAEIKWMAPSRYGRDDRGGRSYGGRRGRDNRGPSRGRDSRGPSRGRDSIGPSRGRPSSGGGYNRGGRRDGRGDSRPRKDGGRSYSRGDDRGTRPNEQRSESKKGYEKRELKRRSGSSGGRRPSFGNSGRSGSRRSDSRSSGRPSTGGRRDNRPTSSRRRPSSSGGRRR